MVKLLLLLLFCNMSSSVRHSLNYLITASTGLPTVPEFMAVLLVDDLQSCYCSSNKTLEVKHDAWKQLFEDTKLWDWVKEQCFDVLPDLYKSRLHRFMQHFNQSTGVHILQFIEGVQLDEQSREHTLFVQCGYDGEGFMSLDLTMQTWISVKPEADAIKQDWEADKAGIGSYIHFLTQTYPAWLGMCLYHGGSFLLKTVPPSVSVLQKSPSSPVSCHATGFYPDRATMFLRKDGQELYEDVDHGEILPNHDGTFQMTVDLNISSIKPEDWRRYDCVFQLFVVKKNIITKLDKAVIRTNCVSPVGAIVGVVAGLMLLSVCITALVIWSKKKKNIGSQ
ncbi:major histocompatibility complex class I-related gene protein-like isoform X2 [Channa argus]|uniref:major histocompatibility complex class I-related gene protein-like isoform X2 n=2 Tax=Channa argus TaxID=215402 RepID=UPI00351FE9BA